MTIQERAPLRGTVDWSAYAGTYDLLLHHNPAYRDLIQRFERFVTALGPEVMSAIDVGAGTGSFTEVLARQRPDMALTLLEPDPAMRARAQDKLPNGTTLITDPFEAYESSQMFDLIVTTHALYTTPDPQASLEKLHQMATPGGWLFAIDFGRRMNVLDWRLYLMRHLLRSVGPRETLRLAREGREIAVQNTNVARMQRSGRYWTHDEATFTEALERSGWSIVATASVYRQYSTLAVCRKV